MFTNAAPGASSPQISLPREQGLSLAGRGATGTNAPERIKARSKSVKPFPLLLKRVKHLSTNLLPAVRIESDRTQTIS